MEKTGGDGGQRFLCSGGGPLGQKESHAAFGIHGNEINVLHTRGIDLFYSFSEYCIMNS
jgi:hypothetical protein